MQPQFLAEMVDGAKNCGVHTAIETTAYASWQKVGSILQQIDFVMVDIKHMDPQVHRVLTGVDNQVILQNIEHLMHKGVRTMCRIPLIPGVNDSEKNLRATARFIRSMGGDSVVLLPFHQYGAVKYDYLMREYTLPNLKAASGTQVDEAKKILSEDLWNVSAGGDGLSADEKD